MSVVDLETDFSCIAIQPPYGVSIQLQDGRCLAGFFGGDDPNRDLWDAVMEWDDQGAIRVTLDPIEPPECSNRVEMVDGQPDVGQFVILRRWLSISAQDTEAVKRWLSSQGWSAPIVLETTEGRQLLYRLDDLRHEDASRALLERVVVAVAQHVESVGSAALEPGCWIRYPGAKGMSVVECSRDLPVPVSRDLLEKVADQANVPLACGGDAFTAGLVHPDGSIDVAAFRHHAKGCRLCALYFDALTSWMADFDPEPPPVRREIEREFLSQQDVAARLGVAPRTIKRWSDRGAFPGYALWDGRRKLYKWADVETFLQEAKVTGDGGR